MHTDSVNRDEVGTVAYVGNTEALGDLSGFLGLEVEAHDVPALQRR